MSLSAKEFMDAYAQEQAAKHAGKLPIEGRRAKSSGAQDIPARPAHRRPPHVFAFLAIVALFAYILLGVGWLIGEIGAALYEVGLRMHEAKWNIR